MNDLNLLVSTFKRYQETPKWHYIQAMFRLTLQIGYKKGLEDAYKRMKENNNDS